MNWKLAFWLLIPMMLLSCREEQRAPEFVKMQKSVKEEPDDPYVDWNRVNVNREDEDIDFFTQRYRWNVQKTGTGLRIEILQPGNGELVKPEDEVTLEYTTMLLTGDTIYTSAKQGVKVFKVDKSSEIAGLNEAVKMLRKGGEAHLVIPSFLAHGLAGDGERIRGKVSLAMTVKVTEVKRNEN